MDIQSLGDFGIIAEILSALAVVITLGYLAVQIRQSNKHAMLQSIQHTWSSLSEFCDLPTQSEEVTSIILRGRKSLDTLDENEYERFTFIHLRLINTIECWLMMINQSYPRGHLREQHLKNLDAIIAGFFNNPGALEFWKNQNPDYAMPELHKLFIKNTNYSA